MIGRYAAQSRRVVSQSRSLSSYDRTDLKDSAIDLRSGLTPPTGRNHMMPFKTPAFGPLGRRTSVSGITATVFGASGFIGRYLLSELGTLHLLNSSLTGALLHHALIRC